MKKIIFFILFIFTLLSYLSMGYANSETSNTICNNREFFSGTFVHPGMMQSKDDLEYMREMILAESPEWINAFENLKAETSFDFIPEPVAHVSVGPYGSNDIGGKSLFASAKASYNHALMWYVTRDKRHAEKTIEILNAWSYKLWSFDGNNAKLNVGLTSYFFLNAAEIIRHSYKWEENDIKQFEQMLLTVFYPTIQDFFAEANGNWDASMINTMMCIGVFTDRSDIFNRAVEHYYRGGGNGGITRYVYPGGQCQETTRDWDHVQLGLGEFAKAAQVARTQGLDFYSVADNRLAEGFEYAAKFLTGDSIDLFGVLSHREKDRFRDIFEPIYHYYMNEKSVMLPYTQKFILNHTRKKSSVGFLTATTRPKEMYVVLSDIHSVLPKPLVKPTETGALNKTRFDGQLPSNAVFVQPNESVQDKIDAAPISGWIVLKKGIHVLDKPLRIKSGVTLAGEGKETVLILKPDVHTATIVNTDKNMNNVTIRDMLIEGADKTETGFDPNYNRSQRLYMNAASREGIVFVSDEERGMKNICIENITVQNFTKNGIYIAGAENVSVLKCDITNNGSCVVPGAGFHHNLKLLHVTDCAIVGNRLDDSLWGSGMDISFCTNMHIEKNELARNKLSGITCAESENITIDNNLMEGNDKNGISLLHRMSDNKMIRILNNKIQNNKCGIFYEKHDITPFIKENIYFHNKWNESGF